jgi:hypothetical protein
MRIEEEAVVILPKAYPAAHPSLTQLVLAVAIIAFVCWSFWRTWRQSNEVPGTARCRGQRPDLAHVVHSVVGELRAQKSLVVLRTTVATDVVSSNIRHFLRVSLGETRVLLRATGQVQFCVPLDQLADDAVVFDAHARQLRVRVPRPRLDSEFVAVDPADVLVWRQLGWARWRESADVLEDAAKHEIVRQLIAAADQGALRDRAEHEARGILAGLAGRCAAAFGEEVTVDIEFVPSEASP